MPRVKIDYIVSFSSEDPEHPANNLLNKEVSKKKWLCMKGETSCSVVLQLAKAVKISGVHIGAYHAALVEVLVARSETSSDQYQVLVPSSVLVSREESRRGEGVSRVRSFAAEQLSEPARDQRWDRVRIVCSQPYNKHCKYGLSFVHIDEAESAGTGSAVPPRLLAFDTFSSDEDEFKPGELFAKHLQKNSAETTATTTLNTGAQIRQATSQALKNISESSTKLTKATISKRHSNAAGGVQDNDRSVGVSRRDKTSASRDQTSVSRDQTSASRDQTSASRGQTFASRDQTSASRGQTSASRGQTFASRDQTSASRDRTSASRDRTSASRDQTSASSDQTSASSDQISTSSDDHAHSSRDRGRVSTDALQRRSRTHQNNQSSSSHKTDDQVRKRRRSNSEEDCPGEVSSEPERLLSDVVLVLSGYENPRRAALRNTALALGARVLQHWGPACTHLICAFPSTPKLRALRASEGRGGGPAPAPRGEWLEQCAARRRRLPWRWFAAEPAHARAEPRALPRAQPRDPDTEGDTDEEIEKVLRKQKKRRMSDEESANESRDTRATKPATESVEEGDSTDEEPAAAAAAAARLGGALPALLAGRAFCVRAAPPLRARLTRYVRAYAGLVLDEATLDEDSVVDYLVCGDSDGARLAGEVRARVSPAWLARCLRARALLPDHA